MLLLDKFVLRDSTVASPTSPTTRSHFSHEKQRCVAHQQLYDPFSSACNLRSLFGGVHSTWGKLWCELVFVHANSTNVHVVRTMGACANNSIEGWRSMYLFAKQPLECIRAARPTPFDQWSALATMSRPSRHFVMQPGHYRVTAGNVATKFTPKSKQMYPEQTLGQFHGYDFRATEPLFSD